MLSLNHISVIFVIGGFVVALVGDRIGGRESRLEDLLSKAFAAGTIPTGGFLLAAAFDPTLLLQLGDIHIQAAAAGLATLFVGIQAFFER